MAHNHDVEIGDSVVFANMKDWAGCTKSNPFFRSAQVTDLAGELVQLQYRTLFGFLRRRWIRPGCKWQVHRKRRHDEILRDLKKI